MQDGEDSDGFIVPLKHEQAGGKIGAECAEGRDPVARTSCGKAGSGLRAGTSLSQAPQHVRALARHDRDKSRMRGALGEADDDYW
jgi:hypothetical protein